MPSPVRPETAHEEAEALLPWYATGQLEPADRALVERHLESCAECQRQLQGERMLIDEFQTLTPEIDTSWARLRSRIEPRQHRKPQWRQAVGEFWQLLNRPAVVALAAAQLAFVLAGTLALSLSRPTYYALGGAQEPASANILVIFRPETKEAELRDSLRSSGASLVGGPTAADAYLLHVPAQARPGALAKLRADKDVLIAQPIDGAAQ
jgi:anti-sigma-K factor RskA